MTQKAWASRLCASSGRASRPSAVAPCSSRCRWRSAGHPDTSKRSPSMQRHRTSDPLTRTGWSRRCALISTTCASVWPVWTTLLSSHGSRRPTRSPPIRGSPTERAERVGRAARPLHGPPRAPRRRSPIRPPGRHQGRRAGAVQRRGRPAPPARPAARGRHRAARPAARARARRRRRAARPATHRRQVRLGRRPSSAHTPSTAGRSGGPTPDPPSATSSATRVGSTGSRLRLSRALVDDCRRRAGRPAAPGAPA